MRITYIFGLLLSLALFHCYKYPTSEEDMVEVSGRIVALQGGQMMPVAKAYIEISAARSYSDFSDSTGQFEIRNVPSGVYNLRVSKQFDGSTFVIDRENLEINKRSSNLGDLTFDQLGYIWGRVILEEAEDYSLVNVYLLGSSIAAKTDHNGIYRLLFIPPATYDIYVEKEGYTSIQQWDVTVGPGQSLEFNFTLSPLISTLVILKTIPSHGMYLGWDGRYLWQMRIETNHEHYSVAAQYDTTNGRLVQDELFKRHGYYSGFAFDGQYMWVATVDPLWGPGFLFKIRPSDGARIDSVDSHWQIVSLTWGDGYLWHTGWYTTTIYQVDPLSGQEAAVAGVADAKSLNDLAWGEGYLWATERGGEEIPRSIVKIDPNSWKIVKRYHIPDDFWCPCLEWINGHLWYAGSAIYKLKMP